MFSRQVILGVSALLIVAGILLVCFAPGGFFNTARESGTLDVPGVQITLSAESGPELSRPGPVVGFVFLGLGFLGLAAGLVVPKQAAPH